ncbi:MAG: deoxyribodipyrimidine photolyase, partial [Bacteroidota bacterium]
MGIKQFETDLDKILALVESIDPIAYGKTRNFVDGAVTRLSPYISRGFISTQYILRRTLERGFEPKYIEKFIQELAWRDYWQQIWIEKGSEI